MQRISFIKNNQMNVFKFDDDDDSRRERDEARLDKRENRGILDRWELKER